MKILLFIILLLFSFSIFSKEIEYRCYAEKTCKSLPEIDSNGDIQIFCLRQQYQDHPLQKIHEAYYTLKDNGNIKISNEKFILELEQPTKGHVEYNKRYKDYNIMIILGDYYEFRVDKVYGKYSDEIYFESGYCKIIE